MPEKERRCEHPYGEWYPQRGYIAPKLCPHPYFSIGTDPDTGEEIDCCIFHASIEGKKSNKGAERFWKEFKNRVFDWTKDVSKVGEMAEKNGEIWINCFGFVFPDTGKLFEGRKFPFPVNMYGCKYEGNACFSKVGFLGDAIFERATFSGDADFSGAKFGGNAVFWNTKFFGDTNFFRAHFSGNADFYSVKFFGPADFGKAEFEGNFILKDSRITKTIIFEETEFRKEGDFRGIIADKIVKKRGEPEPGTLLFKYAYFHLPERILIGGVLELVEYVDRPISPRKLIVKTINTDLSRWSFRGTNIEKVHFVEPCWPEEKERRGRKKTLDEVIAKKREKGGISWADAGEVYRKLRKNFEDNLAYEAAGDFHVGQMECRLRDRNRKPWDRALTFAYKLISGYGENIGRPVKWLLGTAFLFGLLSLFHGFPTVDGSGVNWDVNLYKAFDGTEKVVDIEPVVSFTARAAVSFGIPGQNDTTPYCDDRLYLLTYAWKILAVVFVTFFVLALRRRFRR
jgi:uncharacterized protein YjbI with pentapeptide repeats